MFVDILILATLFNGPRHGYEIRQSVGGMLGGSCLLNNNQLYPMLKRFEAEGIVTQITEPHPGKPDRHVYTITEHGKDALRSRIGDFPESIAREDREFLVRIYHFHLIDPETRLRLISTREQALNNRIERAIGRAKQVHPERYPFVSQASEFIIARSQLELDWLRKIRANVESDKKLKRHNDNGTLHSEE